MKLLSTREAAAKLGVTPIRVRQLIQQGRLTAQLIGRDYAIEERALDKIAPRPLGRPKKTAAKTPETKPAKTATPDAKGSKAK